MPMVASAVWVPLVASGVAAGGTWALTEVSGRLRESRDTKRRDREWRREQRATVYALVSTFLVEERGLVSNLQRDVRPPVPSNGMSEDEWIHMVGQVEMFASRSVRNQFVILHSERTQLASAVAIIKSINLQKTRSDDDQAQHAIARADRVAASAAALGHIEGILTTIRREMGSDDAER